MAAHRIFCTTQTLSDVIRLRRERPYSSVMNVIEKLCDVKLECENAEEVRKLAETNPIIRKLMKRANRSVNCVNSIHESIKNPFPDDIFLLTPPDSRPYGDYRDKMGLLVTRSLTDMQVIDDLCYTHFRPFHLLTKEQKQHLTKHEEEFEDISSWKEVFDIIKIAPINSAIIIDNYVFSNFERRKSSLYSIIRSLVPDGLKIPFHLTIFTFNKSDQIKQEKMNQVVNEIHGLKLGSKIEVQIIVHTQKDLTHGRYILTNYHIIPSDKGFNVIDFRGVHEETQGEIMSTFHNVNFIPSATSVKHIHSQLLDKMRDIEKKIANSLYSFKVGDEFDNRLLTD